jgi:DNA-directed RNA polymerase specialized sigma24 family protein
MSLRFVHCDVPGGVYRLERGLETLRLVSPPPSDDRPEIVRLINALPARQRQVIVARYYLGLSYAEIAGGFGISVGAATSTATHALRRMRKQLMGKGVPQWTGGK